MYYIYIHCEKAIYFNLGKLGNCFIFSKLNEARIVQWHAAHAGVMLVVNFFIITLNCYAVHWIWWRLTAANSVADILKSESSNKGSRTVALNIYLLESTSEHMCRDKQAIMYQRTVLKKIYSIAQMKSRNYTEIYLNLYENNMRFSKII